MPIPTPPTPEDFVGQLPNVNDPATWAQRNPPWWNWLLGPFWTFVTAMKTYCGEIASYVNNALQGAENVLDAIAELQSYQQSYFTVTLDPDAPPIQGSGGTYNDIPSIFADAPTLATVSITVAAGKTVHLSSYADIGNRKVIINGGSGSKIVFDRTSPTSNAHYSFRYSGECNFVVLNVTLEFGATNINYSTATAMFTNLGAGLQAEAVFRFYAVTILGSPTYLQQVTSVRVGCHGTATFENCTLDGYIRGVSVSSSGTLRVGPRTNTLLNGAVVNYGGTVNSGNVMVG